MAVGLVDRQKLVNIADAVREKKGITGNMTLDAIASNITSMPTADNNAKFDFTGSGSKSSGKLTDYLTSIDLSGFDTSNYTDMSYMFMDCYSLTSLDLSSFNTSKVTNMSDMFNDCNSITSLDLSSFDTSKVYNMEDMFQYCYSLTSVDLSSFNTSKVEYMGSMFYSCYSLTSLDLSSFNTSKVTRISYMFNGCKSLTSVDLSSFDTSMVTDIYNIFYNCTSLKNLTLGENWASNSSITSFDLSFCPLTHDSAVDVLNKLATRDNSPVIKFNKAVGLYQSEIDVATNKGWSVSGCTVLVDAETATVGQYALIDGEVVQCVYVADEAQDWGQRIFAYNSKGSNIGGKAFQWGGYGTSTGITDTTIGTGLSNTNALIAMNLQSTDGTPTVWDMIQEFRSKHSDRWFVPSKDESLLLTYYNYWTSSEFDKDFVHYTSGTSSMTQPKYSYYTINALTYV